LDPPPSGTNEGYREVRAQLEARQNLLLLKMLSKKVVGLFGCYVVYAALCLASPFDWSFEKKRLRVSKYKIRRLIYYAHVWIDWFVLFYFGTAIYFAVKLQSLSTTYVVIHSFYWMCTAVCCFCKAAVVLNLHQIPEFINQMFKTDRDFHGKV